ncbi:hypothetical protein [Dyella amyloliquefaciens]|uniref:hypothetical protein n=1 Tax=Dyella amyloliquefaciens TaxID=1770545 RepID=UPI00102E3712|nr:hypothetical protein [Dyella amyloliquefaciens]
MTSKDTFGGSDAKAKGRGTASQDDKAKTRLEQPHEMEAGSSVHHVANQGAPGGTCDDDGDSDNQQDPTRRASHHSDHE